MSNDLESVVNEYAAARERFNAAIAKNGKKLIMALAKPVFAAAEAAGLKPLCIGWTQYTPSFNDGDPCTFCSSGAELVTQTIVDEFVNEEGDTEGVELDDHGIPEGLIFGEGYANWAKYPRLHRASARRLMKQRSSSVVLARQSEWWKPRAAACPASRKA